MLRNETILILANAEWDWETRLNCHHIAERLSHENDVLFVDTIGGRTPTPHEFNKVARRLGRIAKGIRSINSRLRVLAPYIIPVYDSKLVHRINTAMLARQIRSAIPSSGHPIVWIFLPAHVSIVGMLNEKLVIYHCVDDHAANPNVPGRTVIERERRLLELADLVFTTSSTLYESKRVFNPNTFYLPNVADTGLFAQAREPSLEIADDMKNIPRPIAGFIGNITAYKLDFDLIQNVANQNPNWSFVFIGPIGRGDPSTDVSQLAALKNIFLLGARAYHQLPRYVKAFDACLIPFRRNDSTRSTLPMKFFEYLAAGKAVIATELPTLADFRDFFYSARDAREWAAALARAQREDSALCQARVEIAQKYSWDARMIEIEKLIEKAIVLKNQGTRELA